MIHSVFDAYLRLALPCVEDVDAAFLLLLALGSAAG